MVQLDLTVETANTVKLRYSAPAFNEILPKEHTNFITKKYFYSYLRVGNEENLVIEYKSDQSLEIRYSGVGLHNN